MRELPHAHVLDRSRLIDHIPELLDQIAQMTEELAAGHKPHSMRT